MVATHGLKLAMPTVNDLDITHGDVDIGNFTDIDVNEIENFLDEFGNSTDLDDFMNYTLSNSSTEDWVRYRVSNSQVCYY